MSHSTSLASTSFLGYGLNRLSQGRFFSQTEQRSNFKLPAALGGEGATAEKKSDAPAVVSRTSTDDVESGEHGQGESLSRTRSSAPRNPQDVKPPSDVTIVDWYSEDDPDNPQNWTHQKKALATGLVSFMTFAVYAGSSIYTPGIELIQEEFSVSTTKSVLGLSLFVLGYAIGPLAFSPLSELTSVGRNSVYIPTMLFFLGSNFLCSYAPNYNTLMAGRFLSGLFGSPALATGGASISDIWSRETTPYALAIWSIGAVAGPAIGPVISSYSVQKLGWRWSMYELTILSGIALVVLTNFLPETYGPTILHRRAARLRHLTGNDKLRSQGELNQAALTMSQLLSDALWKPIRLCAEPVVFLLSLHLGLVYACFYLFFESFPLVYAQNHGFGIGASSLPFLAFGVVAAIVVPSYLVYLKYWLDPRVGAKMKKGIFIPEDRLTIALICSPFIPISLFMFGWLSPPDIHWIAPVISASLLLPGLFMLFQSYLSYLPMIYPTCAASVLASNDLIRSSMAAGFPLFAKAFYTKLGIGPGCSLLGGITAALIIPIYFLKRYGHVLRRHSKFAQTFD